MSIDRNRIGQWIRREIYREHRDGPVRRLVIRHVTTEKLAGEVFSLEAPAVFDEAWIAHALTEIELAADQDAEGLGESQKYCVLAFRGEPGQERSSGRFSFRVTVVDDGESEFVTSEPATLKGLLTQQMRHTEAMMRLTVQSIGQVQAMHQRTIEEQYQQLREYSAKHLDTLHLVEGLQQRSHERQLEVQREESRSEMAREAIEKLMLLAPALINRALGQKALPEKISPEVASLQAFFSTLTEDQWSSILATLTPEQQITIGTVLNTLSGDKPDNVNLAPINPVGRATH